MIVARYFEDVLQTTLLPYLEGRSDVFFKKKLRTFSKKLPQLIHEFEVVLNEVLLAVIDHVILSMRRRVQECTQLQHKRIINIFFELYVIKMFCTFIVSFRSSFCITFFIPRVACVVNQYNTLCFRYSLA